MGLVNYCVLNKVLCSRLHLALQFVRIVQNGSGAPVCIILCVGSATCLRLRQDAGTLHLATLHNLRQPPQAAGTLRHRVVAQLTSPAHSTIGTQLSL